MPINATPAAAQPPQPEQVAAFFDVDNTVIRGASAFHLAVALLKRGFFKPRDLITFTWHNLRYLTFGENKNQIATVRARALEIVKGHSAAEILAVGEDVWDQVLSLRIFPGTQAILNEHLAAGHEVWLVTATPQEIGGLIATRIGATGALGTVGETKDGIYTGRLYGDLMHGQAKADAIKTLAEERDLDLQASFAYSDSYNDLPLLNAVGAPCAINPDRRLRKHAREKFWPIREFRRRRRFAIRGLGGASVAGAIWAVRAALKAGRRVDHT